LPTPVNNQRHFEQQQYKEITEEDKRFERLLKAKKIFKILRPQTAKKTLSNIKKKSGGIEETPGLIQPKRWQSDSTIFGGSFISFNLNSSGIQTKVSSSNTVNRLKFTPNEQTKCLNDVFSTLNQK